MSVSTDPNADETCVSGDRKQSLLPIISIHCGSALQKECFISCVSTERPDVHTGLAVQQPHNPDQAAMPLDLRSSNRPTCSAQTQLILGLSPLQDHQKSFYQVKPGSSSPDSISFYRKNIRYALRLPDHNGNLADPPVKLSVSVDLRDLVRVWSWRELRGFGGEW